MGDLWVRFRAWQWVLAAVHYSAAVTVGVLVANSGDWVVPVHITFNAWRSLNGTNSSRHAAEMVLENRIPTEQRANVGSGISLGAIATTFSLFSGTHHAAVACRADAKAMIAAGVNVYRWADYAMSASLMLVVNAVLWAAPPDLSALVNWFAVQFATCLVGYGSEVAWSTGRTGHARGLFAAICAVYVAVWVVPWMQFAAAVSGDPGEVTSVGCTDLKPAASDPPDLVWAMLIWLCASFFAFPAVHGAKLASDPPHVDFAKLNTATGGVVDEAALEHNLWYEVLFGFFSLTAKVPLLAVFASGIIGRARREDNEGGDTVTFVVLGTAILSCIVLGCVLYNDLGRDLVPFMALRRTAPAKYEKVASGGIT